jgi:isoleucyl-tRNA synthetase
MSLDKFNPDKYSKNDMTFRDEDKWIISRANSLAKNVAEDLEQLFFHKATRRINNFILEDLSRWYVRLIRGRTWVESDNPDKLAAYYSLYTALEILIRTMSPIIPHITEEMYQNLVVGVKNNYMPSIHMEDWNYSKEDIDTTLEENMDIVRSIIEAAARGRDIAKYKLRWPVKEITVVSPDERILNATKELQNVIKDQSNTKNLVTQPNFSKMKYLPKPNLKTLGPRLRGDIRFVNSYFKENTYNVKEELDENGKIIIEDDDITTNENKVIELTKDDILFDIELPKDIVSSDFEGGTVFINTELTDEIYSEAMARELIRRVQDMRKDMDLDVEDIINLNITTSDKFKGFIENQIDFISNEVRANEINFLNTDLNINSTDLKNCDTNTDCYKKDWKIEEEYVLISILK